MPSAKILEQKKEQVDVLSEKIKGAKIVVFVDYKGITVEQDREIRAKLREAGSECVVIKNTLIQLAAKQAGVEGLDEVLTGSTVVIIGEEDYTAGPKIAYSFAKANEGLYIFKAGIMDGKMIHASELEKLAKLPAKEVLLSNLASALIGTVRNFAVVIDQVAKRNEETVSA